MRIARLAAVIALVVIVQVTVFPHLRVAGVAPELGLIVAIAVGYQLGPEAGALTGFVAGFAFGLFLEVPLGLNALAYALVGYGVGVFEGGLMRAPRGLPIVLAALGGIAGGLILIAVGVLVGVESVKGIHGIETISIAALYDALLSPLVFLLVILAIGRDTPARSPWSGP